jgi:hypothetical protein
MPRSRIFHLHVYGDVIIASEWLQNLGLCSALRAFEQGGFSSLIQRTAPFSRTTHNGMDDILLSGKEASGLPSPVPTQNARDSVARQGNKQ